MSLRRASRRLRRGGLVLARAKGFAKDEDGQVLLFTALIALVLVAFVASVVNVGLLISWKVKIQNAVDAAALGAGLWQARSLNIVQSLNQVHYWMNYAFAETINVMSICCYVSCIFGCECCDIAKQVTKAIIEIQSIAYEIIINLQAAFANDWVVALLCLLQANSLADQNGLQHSVLTSLPDTMLYAADFFSGGALSGFSLSGLSIPGIDILKVWGFTENDLIDIRKIYDNGLERDEPNGNFPYQLIDWDGDFLMALAFWIWVELYCGEEGWDDDTFSGGGDREPITFVGGKEKTDAFLGGIVGWSGRLGSDWPTESELGVASSSEFELAPMICLATVKTKGTECDPGKASFNIPWDPPSATDYDSRMMPVKLPAVSATTLFIYH